MGRQTIETSTTLVECTDNVLYIRSKGVQTTRQSLIVTFEAAMSLSEGRAIPVLFDARRWPGSAQDGWLQGISSLLDTFTAVAMLIDPTNPPDLGERIEPIDRLMVPMRVFTDEDEALTFLASVAPPPSEPAGP